MEEALRIAVTHAENQLNVYRQRQSLGVTDLSRLRLAELLLIITALPLFKDVALSDEIAERIGRLLSEVQPALIVALTRDIDNLAVGTKQTAALIQRTPRKLSQQQQLVLIAIIWVAAIWLPILAMGLPDKDYALFTDWMGTVSLALALVTVVIDKNKPSLESLGFNRRRY